MPVLQLHDVPPQGLRGPRGAATPGATQARRSGTAWQYERCHNGQGAAEAVAATRMVTNTRIQELDR